LWSSVLILWKASNVHECVSCYTPQGCCIDCANWAIIQDSMGKLWINMVLLQI